MNEALLSRQNFGQSTSAFNLLLRLERGECVTSQEALAVLIANAEKSDIERLERNARVKARNLALAEAGAELGGATLSAWALAGRLEAAVLRFESRVWPRVKAGFECDLSPSDKCLRRAFLAGQHVPRTQRRLYDLLAWH